MSSRNEHVHLDKRLSEHYWQFLAGNAQNDYGRCLRSVVGALLEREQRNIRCLLLFGGLVRDG